MTRCTGEKWLRHFGEARFPSWFLSTKRPGFVSFPYLAFAFVQLE
jgi:hypothetical protein